MRLFFAILIGKLLKFFGGFVGRSTDLPGNIALKICPDLLKRLEVKGKVIAVTGSNGKTTTSNMIAHVLRETEGKRGKIVVNNKEGANIISGCTTTLIGASSLRGKVKADYIVLEVDERHSRLVFKDLHLDYFLINNLLRDQVVRNGHPDIILDKIQRAIQKDTFLILNAGDPITAFVSEENKRAYFGMAETKFSTKECENITNDAKLCPKCFGELKYNFYHYNHIGSYYCENCGYKAPKADFLANEVDFETGEFKINDVSFKTDYLTPFHIYNMTAVSALCCSLGLELQEVARAISSFKISKERFESFDVLGRKASLMLTKQNSVSLDQSISYFLRQACPKTAIFYVNNVIYLENKDISWLYDVSFERLKGEADYIICTGSRCYDTKVRIKLAGFDEDRLFAVPELDNIKEALDKTKGDIYILAASAFGNEDGILDALKKIK